MLVKEDWMKKIILVITILLLFPSTIIGYECSSADRKRLQKLADNITYTVDSYIDNKGNTKFQIIFAGVSKEIAIFNAETYKYYFYLDMENNGIGEVLINNINDNNKYMFDISGTLRCNTITLRNIIVNIPKINDFYGSKVCKDAMEYYLCQKYTSVNIDYNEFEKKVTNYIKNKEKSNDNSIINNVDEENYLKFLKLYQKYYFFTLIVTINLFILLVFKWFRKNKKERL